MDLWRDGGIKRYRDGDKTQKELSMKQIGERQ